MLAADTPSAINPGIAWARKRWRALSPMLSPFNRARLSVATAPSGQDRLAAMTEKTTIAYDVQPAISPRSEPEQAAQTPDALAKALASNPRWRFTFKT